MSVLDRFGDPSRGYFSWHAEPCGGYTCRLDENTWHAESHLYDI